MIQDTLPQFRMQKTLSSFVHALILCILLSSTLIVGLSLISEPVLGVHEVAGAIWTTDSSGEQVNGNLYSNPRDVHLIGGPQKPGGFGLADGWYYFQVTDPSGYLLSTDDDEDRMFHVDDGCIVETSGHRLKTVNGKGIVQLWPFDYSPKNGGEYKVWVTSQASYEEFGGFVPSLCKTDNFKVGKWRDDVLKYFELWVTSGVSELVEKGVEFYVNYAVDVDGEGPLPPGPWARGPLLWIGNNGTHDFFQYDTTFTNGSRIYWQFNFSKAVGLPLEIHGPEQIIEDGMVNKEFLFLINGTHYDSRPTEEVKVPVVGSHIELSNGTHTVDTFTDEYGCYEFVAAVPEIPQSPWDYKVSLVGSDSRLLAWFEHQALSAVDQTFDFYNYAAYMTNLKPTIYPEIPTFVLVWTPTNEGDELYKLSSTNPGSFHFDIESCGTPRSQVYIEILLPLFGANDPLIDSPNFMFHHQYIGGTYVLDIHVYDAESNMDITADFTIVEINEKHAIINEGTMPDSGEIIVSLHLDYQIDGSMTISQIGQFDSFEYLITVLIQGSIRGVHSWVRPGG